MEQLHDRLDRFESSLAEYFEVERVNERLDAREEQQRLERRIAGLEERMARLEQRFRMGRIEYVVIDEEDAEAQLENE